MRLCLRAVLADEHQSRHRVKLVGEVHGAGNLSRKLIDSNRPDVIVSDNSRLAGIFGTLRSAISVVAVLGEKADGAELLPLLRGGVSCIVSATSDLDALPRACHLASSGLGYISPILVRAMVDHVTGLNRRAYVRYGLTPRETQVLRMLAEGQPPAEIAGLLSVRLRTVKYNLSCVYHKLGVRGASEAIVLAYRAGLVI